MKQQRDPLVEMMLRASNEIKARTAQAEAEYQASPGRRAMAEAQASASVQTDDDERALDLYNQGEVLCWNPVEDSYTMRDSMAGRYLNVSDAVALPLKDTLSELGPNRWQHPDFHGKQTPTEKAAQQQRSNEAIIAARKRDLHEMYGYDAETGQYDDSVTVQHQTGIYKKTTKQHKTLLSDLKF